MKSSEGGPPKLERGGPKGFRRKLRVCTVFKNSGSVPESGRERASYLNAMALPPPAAPDRQERRQRTGTTRRVPEGGEPDAPPAAVQAGPPHGPGVGAAAAARSRDRQ